MTVTTYRSLVEHPNSDEIRDVLTRVGQISDRELAALAEAWRDSLDIASAREAALVADSPLVLDALSAFDAVAEVFADDLAGKPWGAPIQRSVVRIALKAVRDAIAAAYARPALSTRQYAALMAPWQRVFPRPGSGLPAFGPRAADVSRLLGLLAMLSERCHVSTASDDYNRMVAQAASRDEDFLAPARLEAWSAAVLTGRRRTRAVLRRAGRESLLRPCLPCGRRPDRADPAADRLLALVTDAMCALLVADAIDVTMLEMLVLPVSAHLDLDLDPS